ncbi:MAG: isopeptide-forming domain-containing fimbrial protein [Atopobiaceae bacterium]|nr:isopeptide-forming domain-containing fimbrial protein [Atopobiaceae bacterium]
MTSWKNKLVGAIATGAIVAGLFPVAALGADPALDGKISVSGLTQGDTAVYYKIVEQDPATKAWKLTAAVDDGGDGKIDGSEYTISDLMVSGEDKQVITPDIANAISVALSANKASSTDMGTASEGGVVEKTIAAATDGYSADAGVYMVVATPSANNKNVVYKPVFVSADFDSEDKTDTLALVPDGTTYKPVGDNSIFKESPVTIDKESGTEADKQNDVAVGDVVDFKITVPLVTYTKNFTDAKFKVTDDLTTGLILSKADGSAAVATDINVAVMMGDDPITAVRDRDYKVTINSERQFVVEFLGDDLTKDGGQDGFLYQAANNGATVEITYKAKVTSDAALQVNQMDNTATLNFSNNPSDTTGVGELKDKTRHYTFDIDGNVFGKIDEIGPEGTKTSELRKVGIDAAGNIIQQETTSEQIKEGSKPSGAKYSWLQGAEFELTMVKKHIGTEAGTGGFEDCTPEVIKFDANGLRVATGGGNAKSDANGYIPMKGLDAGVYELKEVKAPLGYAFNPNIKYTITITPTYVAEPDGTTNDGKTGGGDLILSQYEVKIETPKLDDNQQEATPKQTVTTVSTYKAGQDSSGNPISFLNDGGTKNNDASIEFVQSGDPENKGTALITNKKLGLLPATGGSGIFFYLAIGGAIAGVSFYLMKKDDRSEAAE